MMCYRDRTYCGYWRECANGRICAAALTSEVMDMAEREGLPICQYAERPECFSYVYAFAVGDVVEWTNENGVELGVRTITDRGGINGEPAYYLEPHDAPWFPIRERFLKRCA